MPQRKLIKSREELLLENTELKKKLARVQEELEKVRNATGVSELKQRQQRLQAKLRNRTDEIKDINRSLRSDIIEFKRTKDALEESGKQLSSVYNSMSDGLAVHQIIYDNSGKAVDYAIIDVNPSYEKITGLIKGDITGKRATEVYSVENAPYLDFYSEVVASGIPKSFETYFPPMQKHFHVSVFSPGEGKFATVFQDITERKQSEAILKNTLERFYLMLESMYSGILLMTEDGSVEFVNQAFCNFYRLKESPSDLKGLSSSDFMKKIRSAFRDPEAATIRIQEILAKGQPVRDEEFPMLDGQTAMRDFIPLKIQGKTQGRLWIHSDITGRKLIEEALRTSEEKFSKAFRHSPNAITITRLSDGKIIEGNDSVYALLGYNASIVGKTTTELGIWADPAERIRLTQGLATKGFILNEEFVLRKNDGTHVPVNLSASLIRIDNQQCFLCSFIDLTQRKIAEEKLAFQAQLLSDVNDSVFSSTSNYTITYWNKAAEKMFGWTKEEVMGKNSGELLKPKIEGSSRDQERAKLRSAGHWEGELQYIRKDGTYISVEVNSTVLKDTDGKDIGNVIVGHDITERKRAEEALRKSEALYRAIGESIDYGIWICDADGKNTYASESYLKLVGLTQEQCSEFGWGDTLHPDDANRTIAAWKECAKTGNIWDLEHRFRGVDGKWHPILARGIPIRDDKGEITMWAGINLDISKIKETEDALRQSEEKIRSILTNSLDIIYRLNLVTGKYEFISPSVELIIGYTKDELMSLDPAASLAMVHPEDLSSLRASQAQCEKTGRGVAEYRQRTKNGDYRWLSNHMSITIDSEERPLYREGNIRDITEQKKAEQIREQLLLEIERQAAWLNASISSMATGIILYGMDGKASHMNETAKKLLPEELFFNTTIEERTRKIKWEREDGKPFPPEEIPVKRAFNGETTKNVVLGASFHDYKLWISTNAAPILSTDGKIIGVVASFLDITENKNAEIALRLSEERLRVTLTSIGDAVITVDTSGKIVFLNPVAISLTGWEPEEAIGQPVRKVFRIIDELTQKPAEDIVKRVLDEENFIGLSTHAALITKNEDHVPIEDSAAPIKDQNGVITGVVLVFHDVTAKRQADKALQNTLIKYKTLFDCIPLGVTVSDELGNIIESNHLSEILLGLTKEEHEMRQISGQDWVIIAPDGKQMSPENYASVRALKENQLVENVEMGVIKPDNSITWINVTAAPIPLEGYGVLIIYSDITGRRLMEEKLRESETKLRSVLNATQESIYMFDRNGIIMMSNSIGAERLKGTENEIIGHNFSEFMPSPTAKQRQLLLDKVVETRQPIEYEDERNGRIYHHYFSPVLNENSVNYVVTYSTDITDRKKADLKLKESEDRFRTIAESLTVMISICRIEDFSLSFINDPFEKKFGLSRGDLLDKKLSDIFYYPDDKMYLNDILKVKGFIENMEIRVTKRGGTPFWIMLSLKKINFMNEPCYLAASIDITETKNAQEELLKLNRTLNANSKSSQAMMHAKDEFSYLNKVCQIIIEDCGYNMVWIGYAENDKQKSVSPVAFYGFDQGYIDQMEITWDDSPRGRGPTGTAIKTGNYSLCRNMLTDPAFEPWKKAAIERGYSSSLVLPLKSDGKTFGTISIYANEPDQFSESEINLLTELANDLSYGISFIRLTEAEREATRIIKESESKLKDLVATKDKFFNIVAHDLKNPFTSLLGSSELLYENISQMSTGNVRKLALILNDSAKGGYAILQNLLDWSRSETGLLKFNPERLNLKMLIDENIENLQLQVTNKEINLMSVLKEDLFILADKNMLNTVLRNLMSNAVKYTYKNGTILIKASQNFEEIIITVKDSGIGIQKEKVDTLFRIDNSISLPGTEKEQGTGLGLKLCKEFTERMGGRIWVESEVGQGSEFKFTIPLKD